MAKKSTVENLVMNGFRANLARAISELQVMEAEAKKEVYTIGTPEDYSEYQKVFIAYFINSVLKGSSGKELLETLEQAEDTDGSE